MARYYTQWIIQEQLGWEEFEDICTAFLFCHAGFPDIRQAGRVGDHGRDAVILIDDREQIVVAFSKEHAPLSGTKAKFFRDYDRWRGQGLRRFVFVSSQDLGTGKIDVPKGLDDPPVTIYDITDLQRFLDYTPEGQAAKRHHGIELPSTAAQGGTDFEDLSPVLNRYTILSLRDASHAGAKRYTADILINAPVSKPSVRSIVAEAVSDIRTAEVFRNPITRAYWEGQPTQAVFLFVYLSLDDLDSANWMCRCQWLPTDLDGRSRPSPMQANDSIAGIAIDWKPTYSSHAQFIQEQTVSHAAYLASVDDLVAELEPVMMDALRLQDLYRKGEITAEVYVSAMQAIEPQITDLYRRSGDVGLPPAACRFLAQALRQMMTAAHNVVLPFSEQGLQTWPRRNRDYLVQSAIDMVQIESAQVRFERTRLH